MPCLKASYRFYYHISFEDIISQITCLDRYLFRMSIASILRGFGVSITGMKTALTILAEKNCESDIKLPRQPFDMF